ncbi:phospholipid phosphatase 4-like [Clinocottus analis]|uniref:phospholipid phosphatase 4-like n=1 Tax=Clinocottus analis TaxID=304258 RepID=UPI0035C0CF33
MKAERGCLLLAEVHSDKRDEEEAASIRLALLLVVLVTEPLSPSYCEIQPEEMWLYELYRVGSDHVPTTLMFVSNIAAVFTPLIVILVFTFQKMAERGDLKEASLAVTLTLVLNGVFKLIVIRPRPNFFHCCFPDGQMRLEMRSSGDPDAVMEGRKSFPRGHLSCKGLFTVDNASVIITPQTAAVAFSSAGNKESTKWE